ncbi:MULTISPECIES: hypothetical protein [Brenneria]|uniref:Uncharacterized protein n=1 Tax=Brenneria goodwinii TaxID=1109412 RepID=A0A0G4JXK2_9GAMM|nr:MULTISPECIES: hypothetical protein [Brenneria]PWC22890.1 hypothetical protein DDT52_01070 [Brenneria roseae subsp. roseae]CPR18194.1 hypothetical protein BN1221_03075c [Brenneria goodwinii]
MAINDKDCPSILLQCNSVDDAKVFMSYCIYHQINPEYPHIKRYIIRDQFSPKLIFFKIEDNDIISGYFNNDIYTTINIMCDSDDEKIKDFAQDWNKNKNKFILGKEKFTWLKNSERACCWLWLRLNNSLFIPEINFNELDNLVYSLKTACRMLKYNHDLLNHELRYRTIVDCFNSIYAMTDEKKQALDDLKNFWIHTYKNAGVLKWLNKNNKDQIEWMWSYTQDYDGIGNITQLFPAPLRKDELYLAIYACYDNWNGSKEAKELFRNKASRAWNQICHRSRMEKENRVAINAYVTIGAREKLKELSKKNKMTIGELIESLIEKKYNELK